VQALLQTTGTANRSSPPMAVVANAPSRHRFSSGWAGADLEVAEAISSVQRSKHVAT